MSGFEAVPQLALAYSDRIHGERAKNIEQAIHHFQQALEVQTRETLPSDHRMTQRNLASLYFEEHRWAAAQMACEAAITSGDALLASSFSEAGRRAEVGETAQLYTRAAYCLLQSCQPGPALVMLERGKTRLLAEALALGDADLSMLLPGQQKQIKTKRGEVHALAARHPRPAR